MSSDHQYVMASCLEKHPEKGELYSTPIVLSPMSDQSSNQVGHVLVGWGQMLDTLSRYTKCLIDYNNSAKIEQRWLDWAKLETRFEEEFEKALSGYNVSSAIKADAIKRIKKAKIVRDWLAHERIYWGIWKGQDGLTVNYKTRSGTVRTKHVNFDQLESARLDISISHGLILHLALTTKIQPPYTFAEKLILQAIQAKGYLNLPTPGTR